MAITNAPILSGLQTVSTAGEASPGSIPVIPTSGLGGVSYSLPLTSGRDDNGTVLTASAGSGIFGISNTTGTSLALSSEAANNNTKTDKVFWEIVLPQFYASGTDITITVNCNLTLNSGTNGASTILANAYLLAKDGTSGATLVATAAKSPTTSNADYTFTVTGTTLTPGARLLIEVVAVTIETAAGGGIVNTVNSVRIS